MKNGFLRKLAAGVLSGLMCLVSVPTGIAANAADQQQTGNKDGYDYELWNQWGQGTATMDVGSNGAFTCSWTGIENCLFRTGQKLGSTKSYTDYNGMYVDYDVDYEPKGNSYMCIYGWTEDPTVEYYIVEAWGSWRPPGSNDTLGTVTANGHTYDIYRTIRENQPSIHGTETFYQYWSVRRDNPAQNNARKHIEGRISISKHFDAWQNAGLDMKGRMYEVALNIEGYQSAGSASVNKNGLVIGKGDGDDGSSPDTPRPTVEPDSKGNYFYATFESGTDDWVGRGDAVTALNSKNYYAGSKSLAVTGRTDNWHGAAISLDSDAFVPGQTYSFSTAVLQESGETTSMKLTLQYLLDGEDNYDEVASADVKSGEWTKLENTAFTIPSGASNLVLYVEAPDSLTDFYIDEARGAVEGMKSDVVTGGGTVDSGSVTPPTTTPSAAVVTTQAPTTVENPGSDNISWGDANCDGGVDIADATLILQVIGNNDKYHLSEQGAKNADVFEAGSGITAMDALSVQKYDAGAIKSLPESYSEDWNGGNTTVTDSPAQNPSDGKYFSNSFDSSTEGWTGRGDASIALNSDNYYSGKSLSVSGRTDNWNGAAVELDTKTFVPGIAYSFSAAVLQNSGAAETIQMTLQYTLDGEDNYEQIAVVTAKSGEWTKLENTSFTIPEGASDLLLYIEMPDSLADFYVDEVQTAEEGKKSSVVTGGGTVSDVPSTPPVEVGSVDISWIDPSKPMVAISFDDGASPATGTRIVDALSDNGFHATFFYVGDWIRDTNGENEVKYAYSKGMEIANHTKSHPNLTEKSASEIRSEYDQCASKLKGIIGAEPSNLLRLPYLGCNSTVQSTLSDVPLITCAIDTQDWNGASKEQIVNTIKSAISNGSLDGAIVLAHETYDTTASAMEELCPYLKAQGWQIVTVSEMFAVKNQQLNGGQVYTKVN